MSRVRLMVVVASGAVCAGVLVGCSSPAVEPVGLTASPTAEQAPTPTPTPTPTAPVTGVELDLSDAELGIVFEDAPALEGDAADVYNWLATYEKEYWRTLTTNAASPGLGVIASAEVQATMQQIATANADQQLKIGGTFRARIGGINVVGDTATGTICDVYQDVTFADVNGPSTLEAQGADVPALNEVTLTRGTAAGQWLVQSEKGIGSC